MSNFNKIVSTFMLFSALGGATKLEAKTTENENSLNDLHSLVVNRGDSMVSYSESRSMSFNNRMYMMSNDVCMYEIGGGYKILHENYNFNKKQDMSTLMIAPDGRIIDINFCNTADFMLPSYLDSNNGFAEVKNDLSEVKKNNDRWETKQRTMGMRKIQNNEDRNAFYRYVQITRDNLENGTFPEALLQAHKSNGLVQNYSMVSNNSQDAKAMRKHYIQAKRQAKEVRKNMHQNIVNGGFNLSNTSARANG